MMRKMREIRSKPPKMSHALRLLRPLLCVAAAALATLAVASPARHPASQAGNWNATVMVTPEGGHRIGNPAAPLKVVEYMSYTCSHCAEFEVQGVPVLQVSALAQGKVSFEVRHLMRDPIDAAITQLTNCVPPARFEALHQAFLRRQDQFLARAQRAPRAQVERWVQGDVHQRFRAIAGDIGLYQVMEEHGVGRVEADRCFANDALSRRLALQTKGAEDMGINGTPSFLLNGQLLAGTHNWQTLEPQLSARM